MQIKLEDAIERLLELSEDKDVCCYYTNKNNTLQLKFDPMLTEQDEDTYRFTEYLGSPCKIEFNIKDVEKFTYCTDEEASKYSGDVHILVEHIQLYFTDGSELIITVDF